MTVTTELIEQNTLLSQLDQAQRECLANTAVQRRYQRGEFVVLQGDLWPYLFMVGEGRINAVKESVEGRRLVGMTLERAEVFWGLTLFHENAPMPVSLEAATDCTAYLWDRDSAFHVLMENGHVMWQLSRLMVARMLQASDLIEGLAFQPVASRLARFVVDHYGDSPDLPVQRDMTLDEMAAMIGTTREQVCRTLYQFANQELIHITRTEFVMRDVDGLRQLYEE